MPQASEVGLIQLKPVMSTLRKALWMADALGENPKHANLLARLQATNEMKLSDSAAIVELREQILDDFKKKLAEVESTVTQRIADHNLVHQRLHDERKAADKDLKRMKN